MGTALPRSDCMDSRFPWKSRRKLALLGEPKRMDLEIAFRGDQWCGEIPVVIVNASFPAGDSALTDAPEPIKT